MLWIIIVYSFIRYYLPRMTYKPGSWVTCSFSFHSCIVQKPALFPPPALSPSKGPGFEQTHQHRLLYGENTFWGPWVYFPIERVSMINTVYQNSSNNAESQKRRDLDFIFFFPRRKKIWLLCKFFHLLNLHSSLLLFLQKGFYILFIRHFEVDRHTHIPLHTHMHTHPTHSRSNYTNMNISSSHHPTSTPRLTKTQVNSGNNSTFLVELFWGIMRCL